MLASSTTEVTLGCTAQLREKVKWARKLTKKTKNFFAERQYYVPKKRKSVVNTSQNKVPLKAI